MAVKKKAVPKEKWENRLAQLRSATEQEALALLKEARRKGYHYTFLMRVYCRYSKLRREREHAALLSGK